MILALNGGGMRGALQAGALSELSTQVGEPELWKLFPGGVYGISVGAIIGGGFRRDSLVQRFVGKPSQLSALTQKLAVQGGE